MVTLTTLPGLFRHPSQWYRDMAGYLIWFGRKSLSNMLSGSLKRRALTNY